MFAIPEIFLKHRRIPLRIFWHCEIRNFWRKNVTPAPSLILKLFLLQKTSRAHRGSSTKSFSTVSRKSFLRKSWNSPFMHNCFRYPKTVKHWRTSLRQVSLPWKTKNKRQKLVLAPPFIQRSFWYRISVWNTKGFLYDKFWCSERRKLTEKCATPFSCS